MPGDTARQQSLLRRRQPVGIVDTVLEQTQHQQAKANAGQAAEQEQPVPAAHLQHTVKVCQHQSGERCAHQPGERRGKKQHRGDTPAIVLGKPQGQVIQHTRCKTGLHRANDKPQRIELPFAVDKDHRRRRRAPGHHDPGDPTPRTDLVQHHVARHLEQHIPNHEQPRTQSVGGVAEAQVGL